ncbi:MAG: DinB family protein [Acidimicrobiia bacterium]|nr:DinB family protein [Acidimicrobiia bacterium]
MHPHVTEVLAKLDEARTGLRQAFEAIRPEQRGVRHWPDRWSAAEVMHHLSLAERRFAGIVRTAIEQAQASGLGAESGPRVPLPDAIVAVQADRVARRTALDPMQPQRDIDAAAAWDMAERARQDLRSVVTGADGLALGSVTASHHAFGPLSVYQWVELVAAHETRHVAQMREIAGALADGPA